MSEKNNVFTKDEQQSILTALLDMVNQCPSIREKKLQIYLDDFDNGIPSACLGTVAGGNKKFNVVGGYEAEFPFCLYIKTGETLFSRKKLDAIQVLDDLSAFFNQKTAAKELPMWNDRDVCLKVEMTGNPYLFDKEEKSKASLYQAACSMTYRHKSKYE